MFRMPYSRATAAIAVAVAGTLFLGACSAPQPAQTSPDKSSTTPAPGHAHGIYASTDGREVLVATHNGVLDYSTGVPKLLGEANDYMGFTGDGTVFYASGHPRPGSKQINPLGLLRSEDSGASWTTLSNEGISDFHALAVTRDGVVGYDGALKTTTDFKSWSPAGSQPKVAALAGRPETSTVLATTESGVQRSTDSGRTWALVGSSPIVQFVSLASPEVAVGVAPDGSVYTSSNAGLTWTEAGSISGEVEALYATTETSGAVFVWVFVNGGLQVSRDGGKSFAPFRP
ncbi:exo-alpha-sialidase [Arthrobacter sp. TS-15]|uniref:F510_1955 family glycosylhydrolase n=1 Tax=Arthrobacter sp. TS-15 TaxID=2510797 RepID=UPI00115E44D3|nr:sialidase family protein [Arthrobacter sp. TS-15]TQS87193.1 exo-alpha-sialidase [Arthrobacter sp. TS-15]